MNKKITLFLSFGILISVAIAVYSFLSKPKIAFFEYNTVYNDCSLKKRLEEDLKKIGSTRSSELDSLQLELTFVSDKIKANTANDAEKLNFESSKNRFMTLQEKYQEENIRLKESYFNQIRQHINEKAKQYAEKHDFDLFLAATGDGSVMYGAESINATSDFLKFVD